MHGAQAKAARKESKDKEKKKEKKEKKEKTDKKEIKETKEKEKKEKRDKKDTKHTHPDKKERTKKCSDKESLSETRWWSVMGRTRAIEIVWGQPRVSKPVCEVCAMCCIGDVLADGRLGVFTYPETCGVDFLALVSLPTNKTLFQPVPFLCGCAAFRNLDVLAGYHRVWHALKTCFGCVPGSCALLPRVR